MDFHSRHDMIIGPFGVDESKPPRLSDIQARQELKEPFVKLVLAAFSVLALCSLPLAADPPATAPAAAPSAHRVLAVAGGTEVTSEQLNDTMSRIPNLQAMSAQDRQNAEQFYLRGLIAQVTIHKLLEKEKVQCSEAEVAAFAKQSFGQAAEKAGVTVDQFIKDSRIPQSDIIDRAGLNKIMMEASTREKVAAFIKSNPDYFNGTKVRASHILIKCEPMDSTESQLAARKKLEDIAAKIQAGKISFEDAAKANSEDDHSRNDGGDLKEFTFSKMVPGFAMAAFKLKKGETGPIVHTEFGFHLIKVADRVQGNDAQDPEAERIARAALCSQVGDRIMNMAISGDCPVEIKK